MSVSSLTTIAAARAEGKTSTGAASPARKPQKGEIGKVPTDDARAQEDASVADVLAKQIPTELIAPYTAFTAAIVGAVAKPTKAKPNPDQLAVWRWLAFALLIGSVIALVWTGKAVKSNSWAFPVLPVVAGVLAAALWAFITPGSPLVPYLHTKTATTLLPLAFAIAGVAVAAVTAALLTTGRPSTRTT